MPRPKEATTVNLMQMLTTTLLERTSSKHVQNAAPGSNQGSERNWECTENVEVEWEGDLKENKEENAEEDVGEDAEGDVEEEGEEEDVEEGDVEEDHIRAKVKKGNKVKLNRVIKKQLEIKISKR